MEIDDRPDHIGRIGIGHLVVENLDVVDDDIPCHVRSPFLWRSDNSVARALRCRKEQDIAVEDIKTKDLWDALEEALELYRIKGTRVRFNLVEKDAPRDPTGQFLRDSLPSDKQTEGRIFNLCKRFGT